MSDCAADRRRVGAGGDVELGGDQLFGQDYTGVPTDSECSVSLAIPSCYMSGCPIP